MPRLPISQRLPLAIRKCSIREQSRRESNGTKHRETAQINAEIAGDGYVSKQKQQRQHIDKARFNASVLRNRLDHAYNDARIAFGPRLVLPDGTARYSLAITGLRASPGLK